MVKSVSKHDPFGVHIRQVESLKLKAHVKKRYFGVTLKTLRTK